MTGRHSCRVRCAGAVTTAPRCACESMPPLFRSPSAPGSAPPRPAGRPGYRSRPRAHAASTSRPLPGGRGTRRCSGTRPGCSRIGGRGIRPAVSEKTFQRPGDLLQHQLHAADSIVLQLRIAPLRSGHDRMRACRQQDLDMVQAGSHDGTELVPGQGGNKIQNGWRGRLERRGRFSRFTFVQLRKPSPCSAVPLVLQPEQ